MFLEYYVLEIVGHMNYIFYQFFILGDLRRSR